MVPKKRQKITIEVEERFELPSFYTTASLPDRNKALTIGAALVPAFGECVSLATREESVADREKQLTHHQEQLDNIIQAHTLQMNEQRANMETRLDEAKDESVNLKLRVKELVTDNDKLSVALEGDKSEGWAETKGHFSALTKHSAEMSELYSHHHNLIKQLDESTVKIRAKEFMFYQESKRLNFKMPHLHVPMQLPYEEAVDFARDRYWNNVTRSKVEEIEAGLGKDAFKEVMRLENKPTTE